MFAPIAMSLFTAIFFFTAELSAASFEKGSESLSDCQEVTVEALFSGEMPLLLLDDQSVYWIIDQKSLSLLQMGDRLLKKGDTLFWQNEPLALSLVGHISLSSSLTSLSPMPLDSADLEKTDASYLALLENNSAYAFIYPESNVINSWQPQDLIAVIQYEEENDCENDCKNDQWLCLLLNLSQGNAEEAALLGQAMSVSPLTAIDAEGKKLAIANRHAYVAPFCQQRARQWQEGESVVVIEHAFPAHYFLSLEFFLTEPSLLDAFIFEEWVAAWKEWLFADDLRLMTVRNVERNEVIYIWSMSCDWKDKK